MTGTRLYGGVRLLGARATEAGLREAVRDPKHPRWRSIHLACHGIANATQPSLSALAVTPAGEDDGFLTALEVLEMRMSADLAVLSACESGRGKLVRGEGLVGLARAFMIGAPRVIVSLWKVDDQATLALMKKFYELWNPKDSSAKMGTAAALKKAQEYVRSQEGWKHPQFWAPWLLWGLPD